MNDIKVSVICTAYNHEKFIEKSLKSVLSQKTNFDFEIIVHDDASDDGTADIIMNYYNRFPDKIVPIIQKENQYSKGINVFSTYIVPKAKGKYIAFLECDDFWCDDSKLQKQYDYMEKNLNCSMCVHNTYKYNLMNDNKQLFNNWDNVHILTKEDVFMGWNVHFSAYFLRKNTRVYVKEFEKYWCGDFVILCWFFYQGEIVCLPEVMSVYNYNNTQGMTYTYYMRDKKIQIDRENERIEFLKKYDALTQGKYRKIIRKRVQKTDFYNKLYESELLLSDKKNKNKIKLLLKEIKGNPYYSSFLKGFSNKKRIYVKFKTSSYASLWIAFKLKRLIQIWKSQRN